MAEEKKSFGDFLVGLGVIATDQFKKASLDLKRGERLEQAIVRLGYAKEELVLQCLADYFNLPYIDLDTYLIDEKIVKTIPEEIARRHTLIPLFKIGNALTVAMTNPLNILAMDEVRNKAKLMWKLLSAQRRRSKRRSTSTTGPHPRSSKARSSKWQRTRRADPSGTDGLPEDL